MDIIDEDMGIDLKMEGMQLVRDQQLTILTAEDIENGSLLTRGEQLERPDLEGTGASSVGSQP